MRSQVDTVLEGRNPTFQEIRAHEPRSCLLSHSLAGPHAAACTAGVSIGGLEAWQWLERNAKVCQDRLLSPLPNKRAVLEQALSRASAAHPSLHRRGRCACGLGALGKATVAASSFVGWRVVSCPASEVLFAATCDLRQSPSSLGRTTSCSQHASSIACKLA